MFFFRALHNHPGLHHWHWQQMYWRRHRPSRLLWFAFGATAATIYNLRTDARLHYDNKRYWGHCLRAPIQVPPGLPDSPLQTTGLPPQMQPQTSSQETHRPSWGLGPLTDLHDEQWEKDKEKLINLAKHAQDTVTDLSETTLDSIQATVESLKARLIEHRTQREAQQKRLEEQRKNSPPRWI